MTDDSDEDNFEDGLDFEGQEEEEDIAGIRRRLSNEAAVARVGEALDQTLGADRDEEAVPRDHFSPVQVRFPVNAPALRPPAIEENMPDIDIAVENGQDGEKAQDLARSIKVEFDPQDIKFSALKEKSEQLGQYAEGDVVNVKFDLRGREYNGQYYVDLNAWRIVDHVALRLYVSLLSEKE